MFYSGKLTSHLVLTFSLILAVRTGDITADFENANDCSRRYTNPYSVPSEDRYLLIARPRQNDFGGAIQCILHFASYPPGKALRFFTRDFSITDCGVSLEVFDQLEFINTPKYTLTCETAPNQVYVIPSGRMQLRLAKTSPVAYSYNFDMRLTTDDSPYKEDPDDVYRPGVQRSTLTEGAIIGVTVSCVVGGLVLLIIIILVIRRKRKMNRESRASKQPYQEKQNQIWDSRISEPSYEKEMYSSRESRKSNPPYEEKQNRNREGRDSKPAYQDSQYRSGESPNNKPSNQEKQYRSRESRNSEPPYQEKQSRSRASESPNESRRHKGQVIDPQNQERQHRSRETRDIEPRTYQEKQYRNRESQNSEQPYQEKQHRSRESQNSEPHYQEKQYRSQASKSPNGSRRHKGQEVENDKQYRNREPSYQENQHRSRESRNSEPADDRRRKSQDSQASGSLYQNRRHRSRDSKA